MRRWVESFRVAQVDGPALVSSASATSLLQVAQKKRLDPGTLLVGSKLIIKAHGRVSVSGAALNLTLDVRFVGAPDSASPTTVVVANGGAMAMTTTGAKTDVAWNLEWELVCRAIGASANLMHQGEFKSEAFGTSAVVGEAKMRLLPASTPAVGSNFDSSQIQVVDLFGTWGTPSASNSIQVHGYELISEN
jgi:hypothetical protein